MRSASIVAALFALVACVSANKSPFDGTVVKPLSGVTSFTQVVRAVDEATIFFIYDSAEVNSLRTIPQFTKAAAPLSGFANFYAIDIRDATVAWALDAWNVQLVPAVRGVSAHRTPRPGFEKAGLVGGLGGTRQFVEMQLERGLSEASLKRFVLSMQGEAPVIRVETDAKAESLHAHVTSPRETPSVVLISNKPTSSQLFKAVSISLNGRCDVYDVFTGKAKNAQKLFDAKKVPKLLVFDAQGVEHEYTGALTPTAIVAFVEKFTTNRESQAQKVWDREALALAREAKRHEEPLLRVDSSMLWDSDVLSRGSAVGVFVFDAVEEAQSAAEVVRDLKARSGSSVSNFVWVLRSDAPKLATALTATQGGASAKLAFLSTRKSVITKYDGEVSASAIHEFATGPLSRGVGAQPYKSLPAFGQ